MAATNTRQYDAYKATEISTANQGKLIVMLYDGAMRFLKIARENMASPRTYDVANSSIIKSQDIVTELMLSLNLEQGGEIAQNLFNIYAYMKKRLLEANINKDPAIIDEVITHLEELKAAWDEVAMRELQGGAPASRPSVRAEQGISFSIQG